MSVSNSLLGPNIHVFGAVWLKEGHIEVLTQSFPLYFNSSNTRAMEDFLRFLTSLQRLFHSISTIYLTPSPIHFVTESQISFPYPRAYPHLGGDGETKFTYNKRISNTRLTFTARTDDEERRPIIVKFGSGRYGVKAHQAAARTNLAPELLSYQELPGSMWMVVMAPLRAGFESCSRVRAISNQCKEAIKDTVDCFHKLDFVHGDLRDASVFVRRRDGVQWDCQLIDFDWAGRDGEVRYPPLVFINEDVWRPRIFESFCV